MTYTYKLYTICFERVYTHTCPVMRRCRTNLDLLWLAKLFYLARCFTQACWCIYLGNPDMLLDVDEPLQENLNPNMGILWAFRTTIWSYMCIRFRLSLLWLLLVAVLLVLLGLLVLLVLLVFSIPMFLVIIFPALKICSTETWHPSCLERGHVHRYSRTLWLSASCCASQCEFVVVPTSQ